MMINDLEYVEVTEQIQDVKGGLLLLSPTLFTSMSDFRFNSLVVGAFGSFGGGETQILTTATSQGYTTGFSFIYQSVAIGGNLTT